MELDSELVELEAELAGGLTIGEELVELEAELADGLTIGEEQNSDLDMELMIGEEHDEISSMSAVGSLLSFA